MSEVEIDIKIDINECVGDGICVEKCPMGVLEMGTMGKKKIAKVADLGLCIQCHTCELECPYNAIKVYPPLGEEFDGME
jgi:NAD-dependent dihydropyrimidine dehydrogenase PreA subunit